jgi:superfamily II DNA/RNA helicase
VGIEISKIIKDAIQITMKIESIKLDNVQQFYYKCKKGGKIDYVMDIFNSFNDNTQTIIFVNTKAYAE